MIRPFSLFLIRHGRTGLEGRYKGQIDVPLTSRGVKDMEASAAALKRILKGKKINALYTSDLTRAVQSAGVIAERLGIRRVTPMELLRERAFGEWEGMRFDEIEKKYPREFARWVSDPFVNNPVGGETSSMVKRRALRALKEIMGPEKKLPGGRVAAIVSHNGILRTLLCHFLGMPYRNIFRVSLDFGCLSLVEIYEDRTPVVKFMNYSLMDQTKTKTKTKIKNPIDHISGAKQKWTAGVTRRASERI